MMQETSLNRLVSLGFTWVDELFDDSSGNYSCINCDNCYNCIDCENCHSLSNLDRVRYAF